MSQTTGVKKWACPICRESVTEGFSLTEYLTRLRELSQETG